MSLLTTLAWSIVPQATLTISSTLPPISVGKVLTPDDHSNFPVEHLCCVIPAFKPSLNSTIQLFSFVRNISAICLIQVLYLFSIEPVPSFLFRFYPSKEAKEVLNMDNKAEAKAPSLLPQSSQVIFDYFLSQRVFPRGLHVHEWLSYRFPPYFQFFRISIFEEILDSAQIFYALVSTDFSTLVFVAEFKHTTSVRFIPAFIYQKQLYALFYKVSDDLPPTSISVPFLLVFLVQQILINFLTFTIAPFCATKSEFPFHDKKGSYSNVYFTPESLSQAFWIIHTDFYPSCKYLVDVAQGNYHPSEHISMYDFQWNFSFFLNGNFGLGNLFTPQSGIIPVAKAVAQAELFDVKGYIIVSLRLHNLLTALQVLPTNCVKIFPTNTVAFFDSRGRQLPPSPSRQVFYCLGYKSATYNVLLTNNTFTLPEKLTPTSIGLSKLPYLTHISTILSNFRHLEYNLSKIENIVSLDVDVYDVPLAKLARHYPRRGFTFKQLKGLQNGRIQLPPTALFSSKSYRRHQQISHVSKKQCLSIRERLQKGHFCSFCLSNHLKKCCLFYEDNYQPFDEYTRDLQNFVRNFPQRKQTTFAGIPIEKLRKTFAYLRLAEKYFWAEFLKAYPHHTEPSPGFLFFCETSKKTGWLWATNAPLWLIMLAICGIFNPYLQFPFPAIVDPGPPPDKDQWPFWTKKVDELIGLGFAVPSNKQQNRIISPSFLINWDQGDFAGRTRWIVNFIFLNRLFPDYPFSLLRTRELLVRFSGKGHNTFNYDVSKAYETMLLSPLTWPDFGVWVWYNEKWIIIQCRAPMFGMNFYPVLFNAKHKAETAYLLNFNLNRYSSYDNGLIFINTTIWDKAYFPELLNYLCEFFIKIQAPLNPEYGMKITPVTKFLGKYLDFVEHHVLPSLKSMRKFIHLLHAILWTEKISCAQAAKCAGFLQSIGEHPLHRSMSRVFYNFLTKHTPLHDWRKARQKRSKAWTCKHPLPEHVLQILQFWSQLIYQPDYLRENWSNHTVARFEIISDANPEYGATTNWLNDTFLSRSIFISSPNKHSFEFELLSLKNAVYFLDTEFRKFPRGSVSLTLTCDNRATVKHLNHGAPQFTQNHEVLQLMSYFAQLNIRFVALWKHRSFDVIQEVDTSSRLPTVLDYQQNLGFFHFLHYKFPKRRFKFFFTSHLECSQVLTHFAKFLNKLDSWDFVKHTPIFGPLFDNNTLHFVIPKMIKLGKPILFFIPRFYNCLFYQTLHPVCTFHTLPFKLTSEMFAPALLRYPLQVALFDP